MAEVRVNILEVREIKMTILKTEVKLWSKMIYVTISCSVHVGIAIILQSCCIPETNIMLY